MQMYQLYCLAKESGKPIYLLGQTLGPFRSEWHRRLAETMFAGCERIVIREKYSGAELGKFSEKILHGADDALYFHTAIGNERRAGPAAPVHSDASQLVLGLNLR